MDAKPTPPAHWSQEPFEIDRTLDGELPAAQRQAREAEIAVDADLAMRLAPRAGYLAALRRAGADYRAALAERVPAELESRVRFALARGRRGGRWRHPGLAAAALLLAGLVVSSVLLNAGTHAQAMPPEVIRAVEAARSDVPGPRTCADDESNPRYFPPVRDGALQILHCVHDRDRTVAKLYRPEDLPSVGYVAVAQEGAGSGPDIGMTELGDMVVFDLAYGRQRHYLAVSSAWLEGQRARTPGRASCVACHNRSRRGLANPHNIVKRSWQLR